MKLHQDKTCFGILIVLLHAQVARALPAWNSADHFRTLVTVNTRGITRSNSPANVDLNFPQLLVDQGGAGTFDPNTVEVIAYDANGNPVIYDATRSGNERYQLPNWIQPYYGIPSLTLHFLLPTATYTQYAVYFDTTQSGLGQPLRYPGLVGDGDFFREGFKRREINASHFDAFCDLDGDGDLDLFKGGVEPYVYVSENVGGNKFVDRGIMTSGGSPFLLPRNTGSNRSWVTFSFYDWDGDGDQDFFPSFTDGPDSGKIVFYRNTTSENGGRLTFTRVAPLQTISGTYVAGGAQAGGWFPSITFVKDWDGDGDGRTDFIVGNNNHCYLYRNLGLDSNGNIRLADAVNVQSDGADIVLTNPRFEIADIDNDGDKDLIGVSQGGDFWWYENIDTSVPRQHPTFARRSIIVDGQPNIPNGGHLGIKVADFTGDGLLDIVVGSAWQSCDTVNLSAPRDYGALYQNIGTATVPLFARKDADHGSPYTERFQICDAMRQNVVRSVDWNNDGKIDLLAGDSQGFIWYFRNTTNQRFPIFDTGVKLTAAGAPINFSNVGYPRHDITDWNNDGKKDLIVADAVGKVTLFLNVGTDANPILAAGQAVQANGAPIVRGTRAQLTISDWDKDGKKDIIYSDQENAGFYWYRNIGTDAAPVFGTSQQILFGGQAVTYTRPNMGSYIDWDGDGKKDFIAAEFEVTIRYYRNTGSGAANQTPTFNNPDGTIIVQPFSIMTISGADVRDWNGDGDLDVLTGQGHAASGIRFYERDYINDFRNNTSPIVDPGADNTPPAPVVSMTAAPANRQITLTWTNSTSPDFTATMIRYRNDQFPADPADGTLLADAIGVPGYHMTLVHTNTLNNTTYYYAAFAHDAKPNYAAPAQATARYVLIPDLDHDGDVDQADFGILQNCLTPSGESIAPGCESADLNTDVVIDYHDLDIFLSCMAGPNQTPLCQ